MSKLSGKTAGALAGAALLAVSGAGAALPAFAQGTTDTADAAIVAQESDAAATVKPAYVAGEFSYDQNVLTANSTIGNMFSKAAATLCQSQNLNDGICLVHAAAIAICNNGAQVDALTVADMAESEGATSYVMGCTCASNVAGGGAIANADVEGVALESVYNLASQD